MGRRAPKGDTTRQVTQLQQLAIPLLLAGKSHTEVASAIGVHRGTLQRWLAYDVAFVAEINAQRAEVMDAATDRQRALLAKALARVEAELEGPNGGRVAMWLIDRMGTLPAVGPCESEYLVNQRAEVDREARWDARMHWDAREAWLDYAHQELAAVAGLLPPLQPADATQAPGAA